MNYFMVYFIPGHRLLQRLTILSPFLFFARHLQHFSGTSLFLVSSKLSGHTCSPMLALRDVHLSQACIHQRNGRAEGLVIEVGEASIQSISRSSLWWRIVSRGIEFCSLPYLLLPPHLLSLHPSPPSALTVMCEIGVLFDQHRCFLRYVKMLCFLSLIDDTKLISQTSSY
jgi:hypothetical protein